MKQSATACTESREQAWGSSNTRAFLKACSWRFFGTIGTVCTVFYFTGEMKVAAAVGGTEVVVKIVCFMLYERLWDFVPARSRAEAEREMSTYRVVNE